MADFIPKIALDYIKNKKLTPAFSYKDVWHEEHATGFTVAKAMQLDVLSDLHNSVTAAIESGQSFETFKKNIKPLLQQKGWRGKKENDRPAHRKRSERAAWQRPPPQNNLQREYAERVSKRAVRADHEKRSCTRT